MASFAGDNIGSFNPNVDLGLSQIPSNQDGFTKQTIIDLYTRFLLEYEASNRQRVYRDQLEINYRQRQYFLEVDLEHLHAWGGEKSPQYDMRSNLLKVPLTVVPIFEIAVQNAMKMLVDDGEAAIIPQFQVTLKNYDAVIPLSQLQGNQINQVVVVQGIVVSAFKPQLKAIKLKLRCRNCGFMTSEHCETMSSYSTIPIPFKCPARMNNMQQDAPPCPTNPFEIVGDECQYVDVQELKLQEAPEMVPSGEMPRQIKLSCNRWLVDKVKPGTRVTCIGIYTTTQGSGKRNKEGGKAVDYSIPYLSILGFSSDSSASQIIEGLIGDDEQQELRELVAGSRDIYSRIANSIAPAIMGKEDVKRAIACSLFGGTQKRLADGMTLRGDINVLLLGDPSVAKSQFLKFSSQVAPIAVYTSGKGSSAAGLTASVVRSQATGDFNLEAGALVLADGGMVCIDEFDKMRDQDRVAIHEAMEQQTISIAKAGITTVLNSRCSVLAAANPVFGRYDDMKSATENIDLQATILSRFDLIFILRDLQEDALDQSLATHLINVHKMGDDYNTNSHNDVNNNNNNANSNGNRHPANSIGNDNNTNINKNSHNNNNINNNKNANGNPIVSNNDREEVIPPETLKKLIAYSRRLRPRLSRDAKEQIINQYVAFRQSGQRDDKGKDKNGVIPITVRQLEAMIRISEAIARMHLSEETTSEHVNLAVELFKVATIQSSATVGSDQSGSVVDQQLVTQVETFIKTRLPANNSTVPTRTILAELLQDYTRGVIMRALTNLEAKRQIQYKQQKKFIQRTTAMNE